MNRLHLALVLALTAAACAALRADRAAAQEAEPAAAARGLSDETRRDIEVMRLVLAKEALGASAGPVYAADAANRLLWVASGSSRTGSSEAFHVAGQGVTFVLRTSDPVAPGRGQGGAANVLAEPTAWDEALAELEGRPRLRGLAVPDRYDEAKVEALRGRVVEQLAAFGHRIRGLSPSDHLTVIVAGGSSPSAAFILRNDAKDALARQDAQTYAYTTGDHRAGATVLTIRVSVGDCQAHARGSLDLAAFRGRATIAAY